MGRSPSPHLLKGPRGVSATATATATWPSPWSLTGRSLTPPGGCTGPQKVKTLLALLPDPQASGLGWHTEGLPRALPSTSILPTPTWGLDLCDRKLFKGGAWPGGSKMHPEWQPLEGAVSQDLWASASPLKTKGWWVSSAAPAAPGPSFQKVVIHQRLRKVLLCPDHFVAEATVFKAAPPHLPPRCHLPGPSLHLCGFNNGWPKSSDNDHRGTWRIHPRETKAQRGPATCRRPHNVVVGGRMDAGPASSSPHDTPPHRPKAQSVLVPRASESPATVQESLQPLDAPHLGLLPGDCWPSRLPSLGNRSPTLIPDPPAPTAPAPWSPGSCWASMTMRSACTSARQMPRSQASSEPCPKHTFHSLSSEDQGHPSCVPAPCSARPSRAQDQGGLLTRTARGCPRGRGSIGLIGAQSEVGLIEQP